MAHVSANVHCEPKSTFHVHTINGRVCVEVQAPYYGGSATFMTPEQAGQLANAITGYLLTLEVADDAAQVAA